MNDSQDKTRITSELTNAGNPHDPFAAAVRHTHVAMLFTDPRQLDNPIVFVNDAFVQLTGYSRDEALGQNCRFLQGPATDPKDVATVSQSISRQEKVEVELQNYKKDGTSFWNRLLIAPVFDQNGTLIYFFASQFDVTHERHQVHSLSENIKQNTLTLDALIRSSSEVRYRISADWSSLYQLAGGEFLADSQTGDPDWIASYIPVTDQPAVRAEVARAIQTKSTYSIEHQVNRADGTVGWALSRAVPILDEAGEIIEWFGAASDITDRKKAETDLRELNNHLEQRIADALLKNSRAEEQLRQSQKLEAIGQLTGGVAHDFNNLLTVIRSSADLLKRPNLTEDRRGRYVNAISDTVERAAKLTGQLLAFARRQALKPEVFAACDSIKSLADMISTLAGSRVKLDLRLPEAPCFILADRSQFDTALVNMTVNARDAMEETGQLTISVQAVDELPAVRTHKAVYAPYVAVTLSDTGVGIEPEHLARIFEPFFTTKETGKGTGLGLSQVFGFAKQSGGETTVESIVGQGSTFTLYLPRVAAIDFPLQKEELEPLPHGHETSVLMVEDNLEVGVFTLQMLTDLGYETTLANSAEQALLTLAEGADRFDVVFTDVVMPGMSGIELGQVICRLYPDLPVVLTSGYSHVLAQNGTFGFELLHKPYSIEQVSQVLHKATAKKSC